jgi:predicted transcriptional regulator
MRPAVAGEAGGAKKTALAYACVKKNTVPGTVEIIVHTESQQLHKLLAVTIEPFYDTM